MQLETRPKLGPSGASQRARPLRSFKQFATSSIKMRNVGSSRCQAQPGAEEKPSTAGKTPYVVAKPTAEELQDYEHPMDVEEVGMRGGLGTRRPCKWALCHDNASATCTSAHEPLQHRACGQINNSRPTALQAHLKELSTPDQGQEDRLLQSPVNTCSSMRSCPGQTMR